MWESDFKLCFIVIIVTSLKQFAEYLSVDAIRVTRVTQNAPYL